MDKKNLLTIYPGFIGWVFEISPYRSFEQMIRAYLCVASRVQKLVLKMDL